MRHTIIILTLVLFVSCGQTDNKRISSKSTVEVVDTLLANNYILHFEKADSFATTDIYGDLKYRNKLTDTIYNSHETAKKIQSYLAAKFGDNFFTTDSTLVLKFSNGKTAAFALWDAKNDIGYNFEHYFENIDYYLLWVQFGEGNCWMLVNRKNGFKKFLGGLPYISKEGNKIIAISSDLEAGYSFNGIELYTIGADSLKEEFIRKTEWGPVDVKWINEDQFYIKREHFNVDTLTGEQDNIIDFKLVTIKKKTSQ